MVIANSDSIGTLVSLEHAVKRVSSLEALQVDEAGEIAFWRTELYLPEETLFVEELDCVDAEQGTPIYLAANSSIAGADQCLGCLPPVLDSRDELLSQPPVHFSRYSKERILYVGQGEIAHAVQTQCDVIVSDKATTCHILAVRSSSTSSEALVSLCHIDAPSYQDCIRSMIQRHKRHHTSASSKEEEKKEDTPTVEKIQLDIHIMGGFEDSNGSSRKISNWLVQLLADLAEQERDSLHFTIRNCAISSLNETGHCSPVGRGLAMDLQTGRVFLAKCDKDVTGPCPTLRSVRLWSRSATPMLSMIHNEQSRAVSIEPFCYRPFRDLNKLLSLPDDILIQYTSTSPDCEEDDFCSSLRATLELVRDVPYSRLFGDRCDRTLAYTRVGSSNAWKQLTP